jgi:hypothetical protein
MMRRWAGIGGLWCAVTIIARTAPCPEVLIRLSLTKPDVT